MVAETAAGPLAPAVRLVRARGVPAQLCVIHGDRTVLDLAVNCRPDDLSRPLARPGIAPPRSRPLARPGIAPPLPPTRPTAP
jgi:hypothetical protein